jgi:Asp-tRNA(Asn)/Glu-tRNA(Gln) amidotransferase B subunit
MIQAHEVINSTTRDSTYWGTSSVRQENGIWTIVGSQDIKHSLGKPVALTFPGQTLTDQAQALVQQYYADINQRDYPAAYNLWGPDMQASQKYCDFVEGYAKTKHVDVTSISASEQSDGTMNVDVTINAAEDGGSAANPSHWSETVEKGTNILDIKSVSAL